MSEIDSLIDEWGEENVQKAFWLQNSIKKNGLKPIGFMSAAEKKMEAHKDQVVGGALRTTLKSKY